VSSISPGMVRFGLYDPSRTNANGMIGDLALAVHVAAGAAGLAVGPLAIWNAARSVTRSPAGELYHWLVAAVCLSAVLLAALDWSRLWFFVPIAVASYGAATAGPTSRSSRRCSWSASAT
jgi:hypothetical protein